MRPRPVWPNGNAKNYCVNCKIIIIARIIFEKCNSYLQRWVRQCRVNRLRVWIHTNNGIETKWNRKENTERSDRQVIVRLGNCSAQEVYSNGQEKVSTYFLRSETLCLKYYAKVCKIFFDIYIVILWFNL